MATVNMDGMSLDENLAELVRNFPVLYDKSSPDFKNKQMKNAAWKDVARSLGLKTGKLKLYYMYNTARLYNFTNSCRVEAESEFACRKLAVSLLG